MPQSYRLDKIGLINRDKKISFKFNGKKHSFSVDSKNLEGKVQVSRFIIAEKDIENYTNSKPCYCS